MADNLALLLRHYIYGIFALPNFFANKMIKKWFTRTTPFVIISVITSFIILYSLLVEKGGTEGFRLSLVLRLFFFLLAIILLDIVLKFYISKKTFLIWILETLLCLALVYYWIIT